MSFGVKLIPIKGINTDLAFQYMQPNQAYFIKNLYYSLSDEAEAGTGESAREGLMKPTEGNALYCPLTLPDGENIVIGTLSSKETSSVYVWVWNSNNQHTIFRINGVKQTAEIVKTDPNFNFQLDPKYFIGKYQAWLEVIYLTEPQTGETLEKHDLYWSDGFNYQGYLRVDDCIATNGFNSDTYTYFDGDYDKSILIRMGVPTLDNCISIEEIPLTNTDNSLSNDLLYRTWKFRVSGVDVFGRPTEHGIISYYVSGVNDCLSTSTNIPRCLNLKVVITNPLIDSINVEYLNDNGTVWYIDNTYYLYNGSNVGKWWLRDRNTQIPYDPNTNQYTFTFCANSEKQPIPVTETNRLDNPLPKSSQSVFKLNTKLALANNKSGFNPLALSERQKIKITTEQPTVDPNSELVTITVYCPIYNPITANGAIDVGNKYCGVYKDGNNGYSWGLNKFVSSNGSRRDYQQYFKNISQSGFLGYLNDGDSVVSTQVYFDKEGKIVDDPTFAFSDTNVTMQKFVFTNKRKGQYIFRIASHLFDPSTSTNFKETSTTIYGLYNLVISNNTLQLPTGNSFNIQEVDIDCSNGGYDTIQDGRYLVIASLINTFYFNYGYMYESNNTGADSFPVELVKIGVDPTNCICTKSTDHNGFYWVAQNKPKSGKSTALIQWDFSFSYKGVVKTTPKIFFNGNILTGYKNNPYIFDNMFSNLYSDYSTLLCNRTIITGRVLLENTDIGVSNALVTLERGYTTYTDDNGYYSLIAHDDIIAMTSGQSRYDNLIFSSPCIYHNAADNGAIPDIKLTIPLFNPPSPFVDSIRALDSIGWLLLYNSLKGLLSGGVYGIGIMGADWLGRRTYIQDVGKVAIPSVSQTKMVSPSKVKIDIDPSMVLPTDWEWFTLCITAETTIAERLEWIVDSVDFIDNTGAKNKTNPTQIKIGYASIAEYNKQNNYSTTCAWSFLVNGTSNPIVGDKVQFVINGDGTIFDTTIISQVKYDSLGQYFLIDYKGSLQNLKAGGKIRLIRPKESVSETEPYFEICDSRVDLQNGSPIRTSLYLNAFDTYYISRQIPVPTSLNNKTETITETTSQTTGGVTTTTAVQTTGTVAYANELKTLGFYFEHDSPSDFWGKGCWNYGRANVKNPYEAEIVDYNQVALSGVALKTGVLNYQQYFDNALMITFDVPNTLGIVAGVPFQGGLLCICQTNNFIVGYGDNQVRSQADGTLAVASASSNFGLPQRKVGSDYGCLLKDKSTIIEKQGLVYFLDSKRTAVLQHDFNSAVAISEYNENNSTIYSWLIKKINAVNAWNLANPKNIRYFHFGINPANDELLITDFTLHTGLYVNNERTYNPQSNETFSWDTLAKIWKAHYSFTPEYYSYLEGEVLGQDQLFSFKNGLPYAHNFTNKTDIQYNTFYGIVCNRVFQPVMSIDGFKEKTFLCMEVYCPQSVYFADLITTQSGQQSRLLKSQFKKGRYVYQAAFLQDLNTPTDPNYSKIIQANPLFEGNPLFGTWISPRLIGDPLMDNKLSEMYGVIIFASPSEKSGT